MSMQKQLPADVIASIKDLDARGYTHREIAEAVGVSPRTVRRWADGEMDGYRTANHKPGAANAARRCHSCGGRYYGDKCRLCEVRKLKRQDQEAVAARTREARRLEATSARGGT